MSACKEERSFIKLDDRSSVSRHGTMQIDNVNTNHLHHGMTKLLVIAMRNLPNNINIGSRSRDVSFSGLT